MLFFLGLYVFTQEQGEQGIQFYTNGLFLNFDWQNKKLNTPMF
jgi:hypothetical protein